jgi:hypothetical protein
MMLSTDRNRLLDSPNFWRPGSRRKIRRSSSGFGSPPTKFAVNVWEKKYGLRALIELSNYCVRRCAYCGIRGPNFHLARYRMPREEIVETAREAFSLGVRTVVLQAGEDPALDAEWVAAVIRRIKQLWPDRYYSQPRENGPTKNLPSGGGLGPIATLLRFETSNPLPLLALPSHRRPDGPVPSTGWRCSPSFASSITRWEVE